MLIHRIEKGERVLLSTKKMFFGGKLRKDADRKRLLCSNVSTLNLSMIVASAIYSEFRRRDILSL